MPLHDGLDYFCVDCWCVITNPALARAGSLRCDDCRDGVPVGGLPSSIGSEPAIVEPSLPWQTAHENDGWFKLAVAISKVAVA